jgi:ADP-heptose:LPS heptosyltransferase
VPKSILVVQIEGIGDYILVRNFLEVLKTAERYRGYSITLCGNESYKDLAMTFDSQTVSDFIWVNHNSFKRHLFYRFALLAKIRRKGFEVVLNPVYSRDSILEDSIVRAAGAGESVGC